jgi:hypothetical protein
VGADVGVCERVCNCERKREWPWREDSAAPKVEQVNNLHAILLLQALEQTRHQQTCHPYTPYRRKLRLCAMRHQCVAILHETKQH